MEDSLIKKPIENNDEKLELFLRLSKICLLNIHDDNALISPLAIESAFNALLLSNKKLINKKFPFYFHNYFIFNQNSIEYFRKDFHNENIKNFHTEFQIHNLTDIEQKKLIINEILKDFSKQTLQPIVLSQKILEQIIIEPITLLSCYSFIFQPFNSKYWEQIWSLKFHSNIHLSIETEFYFTKGFFRVAFHDKFHKIEIPGQIFNEIQIKLIILLPKCSYDLVHLYANIKEYLNLPFSSAFIGVCIPKISMDIDINFIESLKIFDDLNEQIHLSSAYSLGHFSLDMSTNKVKQSSSNCLNTIDLSPVTPWIFYANHPFLFLITYGEYYLLIGQMLGPKIRQEIKKYFFKLNN